MSEICRLCGEAKQDHWLANYSEGEHVGVGCLICPSSTFQPADRAAADRRDEKVRELVEAANGIENKLRRDPSISWDDPEAKRLRAAIAAVREEYTIDKGEPR